MAFGINRGCIRMTQLQLSKVANKPLPRTARFGGELLSNLRPPVFVLFLTLVLAGCGKPVPPEKADYVGEWSSLEMYLLITPDGSVRYRRLRGGMETSISGPLQGFEGDNFIVGLPLRWLSTTFVVSTPPRNENGTWKIVVDGVELTRAP